jgi:two-component system OmpR family response regulator
MHALIIEDDHMIGEGLVRILRDEGMQVDWMRDGLSGQQALESGSYNLALLDLGLPELSGTDILQSIRAGGNDIPLLILTARDAEDDRVTGLEYGADDYLVKPVGAKEIIARVRAVLRRQNRLETSCIGQGEISLDLTSHALCYRGADKVLSAREFSLMSALLKNQGVVLSRSQIETHVYGHGCPVESNAVEVLIHGLRKKFDKQIIRNVRGVGWMVAKSLL